MAYVTYPEGILWRANADGSNPVQLTESPLYPKSSRWSPDGSQLAFVNRTADGLDAIRWWREGKVHEIAEYCCYDVKCTKLVHEYGVANKKLFFTDRLQQKRSVAVEWS